MLVRALASAALLLFLHPAIAQTYPAGPIRWIVPYPAGGIADNLARVYGAALKESLGQPVVVENKPGANTLIGFEALRAAPADGLTLLMVAPVITTGNILYPDAKWPADPLKVITPVSQLIRLTNVAVVPANSAYQSMQDVIQKHSKGEALAYGASSLGSAIHLSMESFANRAGMQVRVVPYKGGAPMITDLVGGHLGLGVENLFNALPQIRAGKLRALAVLSSTRSPVLPDVPSTTDLGFKGLELSGWQGVVVRAETPPAIVDRLQKEFVRISALPEFKQRFESAGDTLIGGTSAEFAELIRNDTVQQTELIRRLNIKLQ